MAFVDILAAGIAAASLGAVEAAPVAATLAGIGNTAGGLIGAEGALSALGPGLTAVGDVAGSLPGLTGLSQGLNSVSTTLFGAEAAPAVTPGTQAVGNTAVKTGAQIAQNAVDKSFTGFGKLGDTLATNAVLNAGQQGIGAIQQNAANNQSNKVGNQIAAQQGWGGFNQGGYASLHAAHGGSVHVRDGSFVIPADVVSALGNGSSKAGARFLTHLFASLERGPAPEAGNLAADRAMQRHDKRSAA